MERSSGTSCGGLVNRAPRAAPIRSEVAWCSWVPGEGTLALGRPGYTRHWPTDTNPSTSPSVVAWLAEEEGTSPRVRVCSGGTDRDLRWYVALHGIDNLLEICMLSLKFYVCMPECGPIPRLRPIEDVLKIVIHDHTQRTALSTRHLWTGGCKTMILCDLASAFGSAPRVCLLYTSPSPRDRTRSRMPSSA